MRKQSIKLYILIKRLTWRRYEAGADISSREHTAPHPELVYRTIHLVGRIQAISQKEIGRRWQRRHDHSGCVQQDPIQVYLRIATCRKRQHDLSVRLNESPPDRAIQHHNSGARHIAQVERTAISVYRDPAVASRR